MYEIGESGAFTLSGLTGPDARYNGMNFEVKDGSMFVGRARVGLYKVIYDNYRQGYEAIGDMSGVRPVVVDADRPYIEDPENGGCRLNLVDVDMRVLDDPEKRPVMKTPQNYYTTAFNVKDNNYEEVGDYELTADRTQVRLDSLHTASRKLDVILGNSRPALTAAAHRDAEGHIVVNIAGTTDEGFGDDSILERLSCDAEGLSFEAVPGQPHMRRSTAPSNLTALELSVAGLNEGLTDDTSNETLTIEETDPCIGISCNGNGLCNGGECVCNEGFTNNDTNPASDCDACETGYENYPTCSPVVSDPCAEVDCNGNGLCEGGACVCDEGFTNNDTNPASDCDACETGYENYPTCSPVVSDPCAEVDCNGNGLCEGGACVCDEGFTNNDTNPASDCDACDLESGLYENDYPACSPDVTPPNAPVITTNGGLNTTTFQANFTLEGTTDADTFQMWANIDGGPFSQFSYTPNSVDWLYNGNMPNLYEGRDYCFKASDKAGNESETDCIGVNRLP